MLTDELLSSLFDGQSSHILVAPMAAWLAASRRFTAFVTENQPKIRKKIRSTHEPESLLDLRLELETAYLLLRPIRSAPRAFGERSLSVAYEPQLSEGVRSADFAVTFTTSLVFMVEVTRLRPAASSATAPLLGDRFTSLLCSKLGQLQPKHSNVLVVGLEAMPTPADVSAAMVRLQQRAEANDPAVIQRQGYLDRPDFFRHYHRLSGLLIRTSASLQPSEPPILWFNSQARIPLPGKVRTVLGRAAYS